MIYRGPFLIFFVLFVNAWQIIFNSNFRRQYILFFKLIEKNKILVNLSYIETKLTFTFDTRQNDGRGGVMMNLSNSGSWLRQVATDAQFHLTWINKIELQGKCHRGDACRFLHPENPNIKELFQMLIAQSRFLTNYIV